MSESQTTIDRWEVGDPADWLHNAHAGEMVALDFMQPLSLSAEELAALIEIPPSTLEAFLDGTRRINGELDLRLARYFRMSPGFFLGLQTDYEIIEAKRALNGALDRIVPRAA